MSETSQKLIQIASKRFNVDSNRLNPDDDIFEKLKINSVDALNLLSEIELSFDIEVPDYELQGVKTFSELAKVIDKRR